ncbi:sterol desaturase family protein [Laceyella sacchari]|uniref:Sterol desaturase family protein n=1 Tax=Laceyella sacchari TaxID=37482 RepID=A0ABY5U7N6_LACSH|nr:sterol desaturase family protein [Laceyella sacchari]TCW40702.1 fatty acid hydroxylase family protein [Laceyella sacchari]UWE04337.1 sterol desaturase family protein [Laceyella sacchari]
MNVKTVKEFWLFPDILLMGVLFVSGLIVTAPQLTSVKGWGPLGIGMLTYAASEYFIHRFLFHLPPPKHPVLLKWLKRLHYDHHADPHKLDLLFLPAWYSLPLIAMAAGVVYSITSSLSWTVSYVTGVIGFLLYYEWCHYVAHRPITPLTPWGRWMKKLHLRHHFKNEHYWYGVTSPAFDLLLGTFKSEKEVGRSDTVRDLEHHARQRKVQSAQGRMEQE